MPLVLASTFTPLFAEVHIKIRQIAEKSRVSVASHVSGWGCGVRALIPDVDVAVLHAGAARVRGKFRDHPVSMDSIRTAAAAASWVPPR